MIDVMADRERDDQLARLERRQRLGDAVDGCQVLVEDRSKQHLVRIVAWVTVDRVQLVEPDERDPLADRGGGAAILVTAALGHIARVQPPALVLHRRERAGRFLRLAGEDSDDRNRVLARFDRDRAAAGERDIVRVWRDVEAAHLTLSRGRGRRRPGE